MSGTTSTDKLLDELYDLSQSSEPLPSVDGLGEIIESYGCKQNSNIHSEDCVFFIEFCCNPFVTEGILRCLLGYFPSAASAVSSIGITPLQMLCFNENATLNMVQLVVDACPESLDRGDNDGFTPLHFLCNNKDLEDTTALDILAFYLERCPEAAQRVDEGGRLPIHVACRGLGCKSFEFCRMLIEAYPGSERIAASGAYGLPIHGACRWNTVALAEYLYKLYPESLNVPNFDGVYPIHCAIEGLTFRADPDSDSAVEMVQFLLDCDPNVASQKFGWNLPFFWVCTQITREWDGVMEWGSRVNAALKVLQLLYDAHPEAIFEDEDIVGDLDTFLEEIQTFINTQLTSARQARSRTVRQMTTRDENGQVPLHRALRDNATLGSIKLLVKRNPSVVLIPDNSGALPLHTACQHNDSPKVVEYLVGLEPNTLTNVDREGNTALHHACRGAKYDTIALLLENYGTVSVSKSNALNKLPIHLLFESGAVANREDDIKYMESVFQLLRVNPEAVVVPGDEKQQSFPQVGRPSRSGKKRKYCV